jgi:hypothetical protein
MATVKTFTFASSAESWTANGATHATMAWDSVTGNPAGSLVTSRSSNNAAETTYWEWQGTWEDLGVSPGTPVTDIQLTGGYDRAFNGISGDILGPYALYQAGTLQLTLKASRNVGGSELSWVAATGTLQSVPSGIQASSTTIQLRVYSTIGANNTLEKFAFDQLQFSMNATSTFTGTATLSATHPTIASSASRGVPVYHGTSAVSATHATIAATASTLVPNFTGTSALSVGHPTMSVAGSRTVPVYQGSSAVTATHATIGASSAFVVPVYHGSSSIATSHPTIAGAGVYVVPVYSGAMAVTVGHPTFAASAVFVVPVYHGDATLAAGHPTLSASAQFVPPVYHGSAILAAAHPTISVVGVYTELGANIVTSGIGFGQRLILQGYSIQAYYRASSVLTASNATMSATSTFVVPAYYATSVLTASHATVSATAASAVPVYHATSGLSATHATLSATSAFVIPVYHGTSSVNITHPTISTEGAFYAVRATVITSGLGFGQAIVPQGYRQGVATSYSATATLVASHAVVASTGVFSVIGAYGATAALVASQARMVSGAAFVPPHYGGSANLATNPCVFLSYASRTIPSYGGSAALVAAHPVLQSGGVLYLGAAIVNRKVYVVGHVTRDVSVYARIGRLVRVAPSALTGAALMGDAAPCRQNPAF